MAFTPFTKDDKPTMEAFNEKFQSAISDAVETSSVQGVKMAHGIYKGTGTSGASGANTLTFDFEPQILFITGFTGGDYNTTVVLQKGFTKAYAKSAGSSFSITAVTFSGATVSWYGDDANAQANISGYGYAYTAFGLGGGAT